MAPEWAKATRPLVVVITAIAFFVTILFGADVNAQGGAYATGVLGLMSSAAIAVTLVAWRERRGLVAYTSVTLMFLYATVVNVLERPEGIRITGSSSSSSSARRSCRASCVRRSCASWGCSPTRWPPVHRRGRPSTVRIIANRPDRGDVAEYEGKLREAYESHHLTENHAVLFVEVRLTDASEFTDHLEVRGATVGDHRILRCSSPAVPNALAALLLFIRDRTGTPPHAYFGWTEGNPIAYVLKFLALGEGDVAPVTREVLRQAEPNPERRPRIHLG